MTFGTNMFGTSRAQEGHTVGLLDEDIEVDAMGRQVHFAEESRESRCRKSCSHTLATMLMAFVLTGVILGIFLSGFFIGEQFADGELNAPSGVSVAKTPKNNNDEAGIDLKPEDTPQPHGGDMCAAVVPQWAVLESLSSEDFEALDHWSQFKCWAQTHEKSYELPETEKQRFEQFKTNWNFVNDFNRNTPTDDRSLVLRLNKFGDLHLDEFTELVLGHEEGCFRGQPTFSTLAARQQHFPAVKSASELPTAVDWKQVMPEVKDQGHCGSCYAFSAIGAVEGRCNLNRTDHVSLSEQAVLDCDSVDQGCNGGLMDNVFNWLIQDKGDCTEDAYPYDGTKENTCNIAKCSEKQCAVSSFKDVKPNSVVSLMDALQSGPVSVAIHVNMMFQFYHGGVFDDESCGHALNHGVLAVGYGLDPKSGKDYWTVRNSWGKTWGEQGYVRVARNDTHADHCGICGILSFPSYPVLVQ